MVRRQCFLRFWVMFWVEKSFLDRALLGRGLGHSFPSKTWHKTSKIRALMGCRSQNALLERDSHLSPPWSNLMKISKIWNQPLEIMDFLIDWNLLLVQGVTYYNSLSLFLFLTIQLVKKCTKLSITFEQFTIYKY